MFIITTTTIMTIQLVVVLLMVQLVNVESNFTSPAIPTPAGCQCPPPYNYNNFWAFLGVKQTPVADHEAERMDALMNLMRSEREQSIGALRSETDYSVAQIRTASQQFGKRALDATEATARIHADAVAKLNRDDLLRLVNVLMDRVDGVNKTLIETKVVIDRIDVTTASIKNDTTEIKGFMAEISEKLTGLYNLVTLFISPTFVHSFQWSFAAQLVTYVIHFAIFMDRRNGSAWWTCGVIWALGLLPHILLCFCEAHFHDLSVLKIGAFMFVYQISVTGIWIYIMVKVIGALMWAESRCWNSRRVVRSDERLRQALELANSMFPKGIAIQQDVRPAPVLYQPPPVYAEINTADRVETGPVYVAQLNTAPAPTQPVAKPSWLREFLTPSAPPRHIPTVAAAVPQQVEVRKKNVYGDYDYPNADG